jgi:NarL family two-component system response regulator LiaR
MATLKVVIVDDHDLLRTGVHDFVSSLPGYELVGEAATARAALRVIESEKPDIVVMDIAMPGMDGIVATREILRRVPRVRVVVLSAHRQVHDVVDAFDAGAVAYVLKAEPPETLLLALEHAGRGATFVSPTVAVSLAALEAQRPRRDILEVLSEREREIFRLAADCHTSPEIARELCLARKTVDTHINRINRKLGLRDRAELVRLAAGMGLVHAISSRYAPAPLNGFGARA